MLESLVDIDWASLPQPEWNGNSAVAEALRRLASVNREREGERAYHDFLYAVGNNHAGTYYPIVLFTIPFLGEILKEGTTEGQARCLDVLIDLVASFRPELGQERLTTSREEREDVRSRLEGAIAGLSPTIRALAASQGTARTRRVARELLDLLSCETGSGA